MKEEFLVNFFHLASKIIIFIAVVVMILGLMMKFSQNSNKKITSPSLTATPPAKEKLVLSKTKLDLKGPLVCQSKIKEASVSAFIKERQLKVIYEDKNKKNNFLILKDCLYQWQEGKYSGEKICGIGSVFSMIETLSNFGLLTGEELFNQFSNFFPRSPIATDEAAILSLIDSCQKKDFNEKIFEMPRNVLFNNKN